MKKVLVLGAVAMDIVIDSNILPENDGFSIINSEAILPGGSASNISVALSHYGVNAYQTGKIGDDDLGKIFKKNIVEEGVNDKYLISKTNGTTCHTYIIVVPKGKHCIFCNVGDCVNELHVEELDKDILNGFDCFYTDLFSSKASIWLGKKAKEKGIPVIYNMQCAPSFMNNCGISMEEIEEMINLSTIFISGRDGYYEMTGEKDYKVAMDIFNKKFILNDGIICTAGDEGAVWIKNNKKISCKAYKLDNVVDTTGAGDCFIAGFIKSYICENKDEETSLKLSCASAAVKCLQSGPRSKASWKDICEFNKSYKND